MDTTIHNPVTETTIATAVQQLLRSPSLPMYVQQFQSLLAAEHEKRERFYKEMSEEHKVEFINGEIVMQSPAKLRHTMASQNLFMMLSLYVSKHHLGYVGHEKVLVTLTRNDYEPDICYFGLEKSQSFVPDQMKFPTPDLVVEILSPSTEANDRGIKFLDYATHGVAEYWIIDPDIEVIEQYILQDEAYELRVKTDTGTVRSIVIGGFAVPVRAVFDETEKIVTMQKILGSGE
jgi:Uma2 family endonuclease